RHAGRDRLGPGRAQERRGGLVGAAARGAYQRLRLEADPRQRAGGAEPTAGQPRAGDCLRAARPGPGSEHHRARQGPRPQGSGIGKLMSWDVVILKFDSPRPEITDSWFDVLPRAVAMGQTEAVRSRISASLPAVDWTHPDCGVLRADGYSIEFRYVAHSE